jgi:hypothetical protein
VTPEPTRRPFAGLVAIASIAVLVIAGVLLALLLSRGGGDHTDTTAPGAGVLPTAPESVPVTTARATTRTQPVSAPGSWPVGATGYTVVIATLAKRDHPRAAAARVARTVQVPGLTARVLDSSQHPRLRPSIWIVYVGRYPTRSRAERVARQLRAAGVQRGIVERLTG